MSENRLYWTSLSANGAAGMAETLRDKNADIKRLQERLAQVNARPGDIDCAA